MPHRKRQNIVLLGIGHTNAHVVKEWARDPIPDCDLICVSKFPTSTYSGMLPGTLGGQFSDDQMRIDLQELTQRSNSQLILADTIGLDLQTGQIQFSDHDPVSFDALSIGVGSIPAGSQQHAKIPQVIPTKPMQDFLNRLHGCLQHADAGKRSVAIVGGGVASVEIALCLRQQDDRKIEIFTSQNRIAAGMTDRSAARIIKIFSERNIAVHLNNRVAEVGNSFLTTEDGKRHDFGCIIWATGAVAPAVLGKLSLQTDDRGFIATNNKLQSLSDPRVFAVGDSGTAIGSPSPKAGVYAVRQCPILWHNLRATIEGGPMQTFIPQGDFLKILNTGDGKALLEYGPLSAHGRWCWKLKTWIDQRFVKMFQASS